jgi:hypothetical protein
MTTLVLDELRTTLTQEFTLDSRKQVVAIRPNLLFFNDPAGTYTVTVKDGSTVIGSASLSMSEILTGTGWTASQYHHGVILFQFSSPLILNKDITYSIELSAAGYTFSESTYVGWIKSYENKINTFNITVDSDHENPLDYQMWSY